MSKDEEIERLRVANYELSNENRRLSMQRERLQEENERLMGLQEDKDEQRR